MPQLDQNQAVERLPMCNLYFHQPCQIFHRAYDEVLMQSDPKLAFGFQQKNKLNKTKEECCPTTCSQEFQVMIQTAKDVLPQKFWEETGEGKFITWIASNTRFWLSLQIPQIKPASIDPKYNGREVGCELQYKET